MRHAVAGKPAESGAPATMVYIHNLIYRISSNFLSFQFFVTSIKCVVFF